MGAIKLGASCERITLILFSSFPLGGGSGVIVKVHDVFPDPKHCVESNRRVVTIIRLHVNHVRAQLFCLTPVRLE